jgi:hypothetical protein
MFLPSMKTTVSRLEAGITKPKAARMKAATT